MERAESMRRFIQEIIDSYETRITAVGMLTDSTHEILERFRNGRVEMSTELREKLASTESLRRKDFEHMMQEIYLSQEEREKHIKHMLKDFLREQREMANQLKMLMEDSEHKIVRDEKSRMEDFRTFFLEIKYRHAAREKEVNDTLQGFQRDQENLSRELKSVLAKGEAVRIKDVKAMLKRFHGENSEMKKTWKELNETMKEKRNQKSYTSL